MNTTYKVNRIDLSAVLEALQSCLPSNREIINLHSPYFLGNEWKYVKECLDTGWVSSCGNFVDQFEQMLTEYTGLNAVAMVNGTAALHLALKLRGVKSDDEVLVPDLTFVATANAVVYCGAIPHFVDSNEKTLGVDPVKLRNWLDKITAKKKGECFNKQTGRRIRALIAVHTFGHPVDLDPIAELCREFGIELIEDAASAIGSFYKEKHVGYAGSLAILSFNGNKIMTTGGGGAILTQDEPMRELARHLTTTAKTPHPWAFYHDQIGYNYRMPNINAALGCAQLENLRRFLESKRALAARYQKAFSEIHGIRFFVEPEFAKSNYWLNTLMLDEDQAHLRDTLLALTHERGIMTRPAWTLMHQLPMFRDCPRMDIEIAESLQARVINIPSSPFL